MILIKTDFCCHRYLEKARMKYISCFKKKQEVLKINDCSFMFKDKKNKIPPKWIWFKIADYEYEFYKDPASALYDLCLSGNILVIKKLLCNFPNHKLYHIQHYAAVSLFKQNLGIFRILMENIININDVLISFY